MKIKPLLALLGFSVFLLGCRHPIQIIGEGDVLSATGDRTCLLEEYQAGQINCTQNEVTGAYAETYYGVAREPDYRFHRWANYCVGATTNECSFNFSANVVARFAGLTVPPLVAIFRPVVNTGLDAFFMGHSVFIPFANRMPFHADLAGFTDHTQSTFYAGGINGSPQELWNNVTNRTAIQQVLDTGTIELFGMAFQAEAPGVEGYRNWVKYALKKNPDTRFFIGMPWPWYPDLADSPTYEAAWQSQHALGHSIIDTLRSEFPGVDFYCIPYGQSAVELHKLFSSGNLPDVSKLVDISLGTSVFLDSRGHPNLILYAAGELVWISAIYGVDLATYAYVPGDPPYVTDLKAIGKAVIDGHDPNYNAPYLGN